MYAVLHPRTTEGNEADFVGVVAHKSLQLCVFGELKSDELLLSSVDEVCGLSECRLLESQSRSRVSGANSGDTLRVFRRQLERGPDSQPAEVNILPAM